MTKVIYVVDESYISFKFSGNKKEVQKIARELTMSSIISNYSHGGITTDLSNPRDAYFSIHIYSDSPKSITNLLWYIRTQLEIDISPKKIKQAAQHFETSVYNNKLWADILEDAATDARHGIPSALKNLLKYRKDFAKQFPDKITYEMNSSIKTENSEENTSPKRKFLSDSSAVPTASTPNYWKIGFFALASVATVATTLALTVYPSGEKNEPAF